MSGKQRDLGPPTIVGLGASAGGLEALSELFRHIPSKTGLAYVIVQHLSPTHGSILAELLARQAAMPVHEAVDGERVEVDRAYVIAPDTEMTLADGHLKLVPRDPNVRPPLPVDAFFRSLAEVQESRTIGVILSGTGSDGALGVRAIKEAGGITFVQDPASAGSDGMPLAAIATNCVDVVATPAEIATQVARLGRHPYLRSGPDPSEDARGAPAAGVPDAPDGHADAHRVTASEPRTNIQTTVAAQDHGPANTPAADAVESRTRTDAVSAIWSLLRHRFGVDFGLYKTGTVERRIQRRMALRKIDTLTQYADALQHDAQELDTLYGDLLIGVTRFFRDPDVFGALSNTVFPALLTQRAADRASDRTGGPVQNAPLRVWVAGCSTGEEAYSMAMCLLESVDGHAPDTPLQIFATDVSETAIAVARAGVYPDGIEVDVTPERLRRFFTHEEHGYRVTKAVRDCCTFARQNVMADPPFSQLDLVSCRNVLIYLQPSAHARLLAVFHYALKPCGVLVLGTSESISTAPALFTPIDKKHRIYTRPPGPARPLYVNIAPAPPTRASPRTHVDLLHPSHHPIATSASPMTDLHRPSTVPDIQRAADQVVLRSYAPAGVVVDDQLHILQFRGQTGSYIEPTAGTASFHLLTMVNPELTAELRTALETARAEAHSVRVEGISFHDGPRLTQVTLDVTPFRVTGSGAQFFVISFEDTGADAPQAVAHDAQHQPAHERRGPGAKATRSPPASASATRQRQDDAKELGELRQELEAARRHLQAVTEEHASVVEALQAANEEIQSSNEELQSTNEELETSKEELQSLNEELTTLNDELRARNAETDRLNADLINLLGAMHVPVIMVGTDLRIRRFTAGAEQMVNVIPTDVGRPIGDIKSNVDVPNLEELIHHVIETSEVTEREVRDRGGHWYMMHLRPYWTPDHTIDGAIIVYDDIDARKRAAEQLDEARRYAEAIVDAVREPLLVLDERLRGVSANHAFYESFGMSPEETIARVIFDFGNGQWDIPSLRGLLERVLSVGEAFDDIEVEYDVPTRGRRTMCLNARRFTSGQNGSPLVLLAIEDVTERNAARVLLARANTELVARADQLEVTSTELRGKTAEALASNQAKTAFLAMMSHELRTPLNAIAGYAQLLDMGIRGPVTATQRADLARIMRSQEHLMGLINEILNFAKLEAGGVSIVYTDVNVNELLASVREMVAPQMDRKALRYEVHGPDGPSGSTLTVRGDQDKVRQILLNLLTNALKFTARGGSVDVTCEAADRSVAIRVRDTGVGIPEDKLAVIFEPFVQIDPLLTRPSEGVGLGLAISRELARAMGGDVTVESVLGAGSTFTLTLPRT